MEIYVISGNSTYVIDILGSLVAVNTQTSEVLIFLMNWLISENIIGNITLSLYVYIISSVQSLSHVQLLATPWTAASQAFLSITNSWTLPKLMSIESGMSSNHLILCHPLLLLHSVFLSIRVFSHKSALFTGWQKYWSLNFNISPSNEHPGLISFRMD